MGNEDVVVSKNKCTKANEIDELEIMEGTKRLTITDLRNEDDEVEEKRLDFVQLLPMELIEEIFLYLEPRDLAACTSVSTCWREAVNSNKVWGYQCDKRGWKDDFDPNFSHFYKAHKQFRKWAHSYDSFSPICQKRLLFNKQSCLQKNWKCGKHVVHKISNGPNSYIKLFEPMACDGRYIVMLEKTYNSVLAVWSLDGIPSRVSALSLKSKVHHVEAIAFDHGTIAVCQSWVILVYLLQNTHLNKFELAYELEDLNKLAPKDKLLKDIRLTPHLKVTQDFVICVPNVSHSSEGYLPIFFWQRTTGKCVNQLNFDSMYYAIPNAVWYGDSCYLSLTNKKKKSYQIVEFSLKSTNWELFSQNVTLEVEQIAVSNLYILAVTKPVNNTYREYFSSRSENNTRELWLWDRTTGSALKNFEAQGKNFQFVDDYLMFFDMSRVKVMNPKTPSMSSEFEVNGTISSIKACSHSSIMVIIKTGCYIEVWDWGLGSRLYTVTAETGYGSQVWCDDKRIITYNVTESERRQSGGIMILGFW